MGWLRTAFEIVQYVFGAALGLLFIWTMLYVVNVWVIPVGIPDGWAPWQVL